jgi:hypothetical protein
MRDRLSAVNFANLESRLLIAESGKNEFNTEILLKEGKMLPVMEHFYTLQGEGAHTGKAAYFIRLGGCDVGCHWCDVKESWDPNLHPLMNSEELRNCSQLL